MFVHKVQAKGLKLSYDVHKDLFLPYAHDQLEEDKAKKVAEKD